MLNVSFPWEQRLYEIRFVWIQKEVGEKRGTIRTHRNTDYLLEDFSGKNHENIVNLKLKHLDDLIFRVLVFRIRVLLHKICFFVSLYQIFVSTVTVFENEGVSDNTGESVRVLEFVVFTMKKKDYIYIL